MIEIDCVGALKRLRAVILETPLIKSEFLSQRLRCEVFLKCENLQYINAFKIRGAENFLSRLPVAELSRGVVAFSSGNHAQGVALAARRRGIPAVIVMPKDAPSIKIERTRELGAEVVLYDRVKESREQIAKSISEGRRCSVVPAFDHPWIIEGQGTAGVEILAQLPNLRSVVVPMSGGGLAAGLCLSLHAYSQSIAILGVEPEFGNDIQQSLSAGQIMTLSQPTGLADGLLAPRPGDVTFPILKEHMDGTGTVSDADLLRAMRALALEEKLVVEPSGAAGYAWLMRQAPGCLPGPVVVVLTGGNVSRETLEAALRGGAAGS